VGRYVSGSDMRKILILCLLTTLISGCVSIKTVSEAKPCNKIYSGTVGNLTDGWWLMHSLFLDVPFSFVLDTLMLPYTVPKTLHNEYSENSECKKVPETPEETET